MIFATAIAVIQVLTGLGFIFAGGVAYGREERFLWVFLFTFAGVVVLLGQLTKFLAFLGTVMGHG